jgi:hypothetical protein
MDFNATIDLIIKDLNETREIIDDLKKYPGVPVLQIELAKSKCKSAAEVIALIKTMDDIAPLAKGIISHPVPEPQPKPQHQPVSQSQPQPQPKPQPQPQPQPESQPKLKPKPKPQPKVTETSIVADNFTPVTSSFNDKLASLKSEEELSKKLVLKPITNLTEAIGVNDRFLFIREIFSDNKEAYDQAITRLDDIKSMADARAIIMSFTGDNNENEAVTQLLDLVQRKLSSHE